ncbi:hypothetical protein ABIF63_005186 [Bradyrhizobium japonicum]|uniref:Uncharacterized protein n=1 Tax=Bradyrhizobium japonicum TaxID=375 RepID=A0ABV2RWY3_BRAJP
MRCVHRDVEYDVHALTTEKWEWIAYPKIQRGSKFSGLSGPTEVERVSAYTSGWMAKAA